MCLVTKQLEPKIADKDIVCYKLVVRTKIKGVYKSSFQGFEYVIRQLYTNNIKIEFSHKLIKDKVLFGYSINLKSFIFYHMYIVAIKRYYILIVPLRYFTIFWRINTI